MGAPPTVLSAVEVGHFFTTVAEYRRFNYTRFHIVSCNCRSLPMNYNNCSYVKTRPNLLCLSQRNIFSYKIPFALRIRALSTVIVFFLVVRSKQKNKNIWDRSKTTSYYYMEVLHLG